MRKQLEDDEVLAESELIERMERIGGFDSRDAAHEENSELCATNC